MNQNKTFIHYHGGPRDGQVVELAGEPPEEIAADDTAYKGDTVEEPGEWQGAYKPSTVEERGVVLNYDWGEP